MSEDELTTQVEADLETLRRWVCSCDLTMGVMCPPHRTMEFPAMGQRLLDMALELIEARKVIAARDAEIAQIQKQLETLQHNYRVSFDREEQLTQGLNDLTMAIVKLFSPDTARRIYSLRATRGGQP